LTSKINSNSANSNKPETNLRSFHKTSEQTTNH